jgi:exopolysaccharide production protein ExoQ
MLEKNKVTKIISYMIVLALLFIFPENKQKPFDLYNIYIMLGFYYLLVIWNMKRLFFTDFNKTILNYPLIILVVICILSAIWAQDKKTALLSGLLLLGTTLYGICLADRFSLEEILEILVYYFLICAVLSLGTAIFKPGIGTFFDTTDGKKAWIGIYNSRNTLSLNMAFGVLCAYFNFHNKDKKSILINASALLLCLINLVFSRGRTGIIVLITIFIFIKVWEKRGKYKGLIAISLSIIGIITICNGNLLINKISIFIGRDLSFSGRTSIWEYCIQAVKLKPFLGYGYNSFWIYKWDSQANFIRFQLNFKDLVSAHNGYIGTILEIGVIGLAIYILTIFNFLYKSLIKIETVGSIMKIMPSAFVIFILLYSFSEQILIKPCSIFWLIQVIAYAKSMERVML